jgi:peptidyl-Asp metalloendopeptidase
MSSYLFSGRRAVSLALAGCISLLAFSATANTPEPPGLFSQLPETAEATLALPQQAIAGKSHAVKIVYGHLRSGRLFLNLPGDISYEAVGNVQQDLGKGRFAWAGHASDDPGNTVVIAVSGAAVAGTFVHHGKLFKLEPRANGSHVLSEVKNTEPAPEHDPIPVADKTSTSPSSTASTGTAAGSDGSVIDLLVAYTPAVEALYGTQGDDALIMLAVAETNQGYINSNMATRVNLVGVYRTNYIESGDMLTDLTRLRTTNDGFMDDIHGVRNFYGADLVSLMAADGGACGIAYLMNNLSTSFAPYSFSVVHHSCATGYYSFAHEIGHNQGAAHDLANTSDVTIYPYAHGYQDPLGRFRTIMAYDCPGGCSRIDYFANPSVLYNGAPTGEAAYSADAIAIDKTAPTVAAFRAHVTDLPPGC